MRTFFVMGSSLILSVVLAHPAQAQITWQNVSGGNYQSNSAQMDAARASVNAGFSQLQNVISEQENIEQANWNNQRRNNTQDYLDAVYSYRTVKDLVDHQYVLDARRSGYGAQIDRDVARSAYDNRLMALMQQERAMGGGR